MFPLTNFPWVQELAYLGGLYVVIKQFVPPEFMRYVRLRFRLVINQILGRQKLNFLIPEYDGLVKNEVYEAATIYLAGKINPTTRLLRLCKPKREKNLNISMEKDEEVYDVFRGINFTWTLCSEKLSVVTVEGPHSNRSKHPVVQPEARYFLLEFDVDKKDDVSGSYIPYVLERAKAIAEEKKFVKLFTVNQSGLYSNLGEAWKSIYLDHPSTFDTLALDPKLQKTIIDDLDGFVKRKDFYRSVGKAWKRGYLLYGPPGTGKSSLIAAIANYLNFDIYDLDLSEIEENSELRKLLVTTSNKSILVIEDIDCNIDLHERASDHNDDTIDLSTRHVNLSGMLNFIDGLWSTCGDERIIIFTTNHKDKLDPALIRPGRMDMHILLSYCTTACFNKLAYNYLKKKCHPLFKDIRRMIKKVEVSPAEVAEKLMKNDKPDIVLQELLGFLESKKAEQDKEKKAKKGEEKTEEEEDEGKDAGFLFFLGPLLNIFGNKRENIDEKEEKSDNEEDVNVEEDISDEEDSDDEMEDVIVKQEGKDAEEKGDQHGDVDEARRMIEWQQGENLRLTSNQCTLILRTWGLWKIFLAVLFAFLCGFSVGIRVRYGTFFV
ncbi:hypothetical protein ACHQM5_015385 [Ranunculus cassubicifolius]